ERLFVFVVAELGDAPMPQHPGMQKILIDRGELVLEHRIQMLDDRGIALHVGLRELSRWSLTAKLTLRAINRRRRFRVVRTPPGAASGGHTARTCRIAARSRASGRPSPPSTRPRRYARAHRGR